MKRGRKISFLDQTIIGLLLIVVTGFLAYFFYLYAVGNQLAGVRDRSVALAKSKAGLVQVTAFDVVTTDVTTYSVTGKDKSGAAVVALISDSNNSIQIVQLAAGKPASDFSKSGTVAVSLGMYKGQPIWEVNTDKGFQIYDFVGGELLKS